MKGAAATVAALVALVLALFGAAFLASLGWHVGAAVIA